MNNSEWSTYQSDRFAVVRQSVPVYSLQRPNDWHYNAHDKIIQNADEIQEFETAIAAIYNGSAGGRVHDKIYIAPLLNHPRIGDGTLFFVIDTQDPQTGMHAEQANDDPQTFIDITTPTVQTNPSESV